MDPNNELLPFFKKKQALTFQTGFRTARKSSLTYQEIKKVHYFFTYYMIKICQILDLFAENFQMWTLKAVKDIFVQISYKYTASKRLTSYSYLL